MGKADGFLRWGRESAPYQPVEDRTQAWREFVEARSPEVRQAQGGRCMDCGVPFCHQGCPLGNPIPEFNDLAYRGRWKDAWEVLSTTNNFPEFTGRLCPAPCEAACVLSINDDAVTIEQIEKEIIETAFEEGWVVPEVPRQRTGHSIAIVGSGPAGLAAAQQLARAGHEVVVYERDERPGGLLRLGIPDFKMEKWVIDRRLAQMEAEGVEFRCGVNVGQDVTWSDLREAYSAVVVAIGSGVPRDLQVPGRDLRGVEFAMSFLSQQNRQVAGQLVADPISASGRDVIILGGGDTGSDCLGTAIRQGAKSVRQIELFPAPPSSRTDQNPWPQWPMVFRTSSSQQEGGERSFGLMTTRLEGDGEGRIKALHAVEVEVVDGRPVPVEGREEVVLDCDLLLLAMGFVHPLTDDLSAELGVETDSRGNVATQEFRTNVPGVYAAGDAQRGASLIVWAISDGREAARVVDADLVGQVRLPTRGADAAFGGR